MRSPSATPPVDDTHPKALPQTPLPAKPRVVAGRRAPRNSQPEVLITSEDQVGLDRYVAGLRLVASRNKATLKEEAGAGIKPLEIAELDVKRLSIEPLESGDSN
jgi:hypothetical protein